MELKDNLFDKDKFDAVWRRVVNGSNAPAEKELPDNRHATDTVEDLRRFMDDEAADAAFYAALASRCSGMVRQRLLSISADEKCHLKKLRARYFILTGCPCTPPNTCPLIYSVPDALRMKYSGEKEGSAAYREAASQTADQELKDIYLSFAEDEARHSKIIGCLIEYII